MEFTDTKNLPITSLAEQAIIRIRTNAQMQETTSFAVCNFSSMQLLSLKKRSPENKGS